MEVEATHVTVARRVEVRSRNADSRAALTTRAARPWPTAGHNAVTTPGGRLSWLVHLDPTPRRRRLQAQPGSLGTSPGRAKAHASLGPSVSPRRLTHPHSCALRSGLGDGPLRLPPIWSERASRSRAPVCDCEPFPEKCGTKLRSRVLTIRAPTPAEFRTGAA